MGGVSVPNVQMFLITNQTPTFAPDPFSGIQGEFLMQAFAERGRDERLRLGMSSVASGLFAGLEAQGLPSLFSLFLTPKAAGNAELTLGGIDTSKFTGNEYATLFRGTCGLLPFKGASHSRLLQVHHPGSGNLLPLVSPSTASLRRR